MTAAHSLTNAPCGVRGKVLQRKCACGGHSHTGSECESCKKKREGLLQRAAVRGAGDARIAPPIVHQVLGQSGEPLDKSTRRIMESRFARDFSDVRVHADQRAAESAEAIHALAYTVGGDVVFGAGRYAPQTSHGARLLAHELTHVVQQRAGGVSTPLTIAPSADRAESEANSTAARFADGRRVEIREPARSMAYRDPDPEDPKLPVDLLEASLEQQKLAEKYGITLPSSTSVADKVGRALTAAEKQRAAALLVNAGMTPASPLATPLTGTFLLHDTSSAVSAASIQAQQKKGRGPQGGGVAAFVPAAGAATLTRPAFFEARRPTTTEWEKALDKFSQPGDEKLTASKRVEKWKAERDKGFRAVWAASRVATRDAAFNRAVQGMGLTPAEIAEQKSGNKLSSKHPDYNPGLDAQLGAGSTEKILTSASWTIEEICGQVTAQTAASLAESGKEQELIASCAALTSYFAERGARVGGTVPIEIVQPGVKAKAKSENTCNPKNPDLVPLSNPPYSATQYDNLTVLYAKTSLTAGRFPRVTTHFAVDASVEGHCDPRCFDLNEFYTRIAASFGHTKGSTYGIKPSYGLKRNTNNVWWDDTVCHGKHP